ncbi:MAG: DJ-1/PfpI family protein [Lachnospiraceae bacterium]|nr:DJ-1/PfpI family protein [Lachnospiraceae bacterium]
MSKLAIFLADGFEEIEGLTVVDICRRCRLTIDTVSIKDTKEVISSHGIPLQTDLLLSELDFDAYDILILPGGLKGTNNLEACEPLKEAVRDFVAKDKYIAAICAAPSIFGHMGLLQGKKATSYPTFESHLEGAEVTGAGVTRDGRIITGRSMAYSVPFALTIAEIFAGKETAEKVASDIVYTGSFGD